MIERLGDPVTLVDPGPLDYIWQAFLVMGPAHSGGMGIEPWDWANACAFAEKFLPPAEAWEIRSLVAMSRGYCRFLHLAKSPLSMSPIQIAFGDDWRSRLPAGVARGEVALFPLPELDLP